MEASAARDVFAAGSPCPSIKVHLLPCTVEHDGEARVGTYFQPKSTGSTVDGVEVQHAAFRGRLLAGARLELPAGYGGVVLQQQAVPAAEEEGGEEEPSGAGEAEAWRAVGSFQDLHYWNHDTAPLRGDGLRRCLEWAGLAGQIHQPIAPDAVAAALQAAPAES